jgi:predicted  nucleic acid-binding Zn ribbon protein
LHNLSIKYNTPIDENELWHAFWDVMAAMRQNGQMVGRAMQPYISEGAMHATIMTFTAEALDAKYHNEYVEKSIASLEKLCANTLIIKHIGYSEDEEKSVCSCSEHPYFLMMYHRDFSPIVCGGCDKSVPLFKLPKIYHGNSMYPITSWQSAYLGCVLLDLNCGEGEKWAIRQQSNPDSGLSKQGQEITKKLQEVTGIKTYYFIANYKKISRKKDIERPCPSCGGEWHLEKPIHHYIHYKCDKCLLMSAYSNNHI